MARGWQDLAKLAHMEGGDSDNNDDGADQSGQRECRTPLESPGGWKEDTVTSTRESVVPTASSADDLPKAEQVHRPQPSQEASQLDSLTSLPAVWSP